MDCIISLVKERALSPLHMGDPLRNLGPVSAWASAGPSPSISAVCLCTKPAHVVLSALFSIPLAKSKYQYELEYHH